MSASGNQRSYHLSQLLEGLKVNSRSYKEDTADLLHISEKLSKIMATQERSRKEIFGKHSSSIEDFIQLLRVHGIRHTEVAINILSSINDMLTSGKRIAVFLNQELVPVLFQLLSSCLCEKTKVPETEPILICKILSKVGSKEKSFCVLARLTGALGASCVLLKQCLPGGKMLEPLLQVMKLFCKSDINCNQLVSAGVCSILFSLIKVNTICKKTACSLLDVLVLLSKPKNGMIEASRMEHIKVLVDELSEHLKVENWRFQGSARKSLLLIAKNVVANVSGKANFVEAGGAKILFKAGMEMISHKEMDDVIKVIILILRSCLEQVLPISSAEYPHFDASTTDYSFTIDDAPPGIDTSRCYCKVCHQPCQEKNLLMLEHNVIHTYLPPNDHYDDAVCLDHLLPFATSAVPSVASHHPLYQLEPLLLRKPDLHRQMLFHDFNRFISPEDVIDECVYYVQQDGDRHSSAEGGRHGSYNVWLPSASPNKRDRLLSRENQQNKDEDDDDDSFNTLQPATLSFESRFESGNLRKAIQVRENEYDLILNADAGANHHHQWFFFQVEGMDASTAYKFNIINCEKLNSQFNFGMQPVMYSVREAFDGRPGWERCGSRVCYYKNVFIKTGSGSEECSGSVKYHYTATFTLCFPHSNDTCFIAYHYPFPYSSLQRQLHNYEVEIPDGVYMERQLLCRTILGNRCDILTLTDKSNLTNGDDDKVKPYIVLTARVHPGETNSSWVMKGLLDFLCSHDNKAKHLRRLFIFKIIPMLNPDGVINGSHRCSVLGDDLNRKWIDPDEARQPTIYHTKSLLKSIVANKKNQLVMFCDFHGHSRRKHFFLFGCDPRLSVSDNECSSATSSTTDTRRNSFVEGVAIRPNDETECLADGCESGDMGRDEGDEQSQAAVVYRDEEENETIDAEDSKGGDGTTSPAMEHVKIFQNILSRNAPSFSSQNCSYTMEKSKASTARIVVFREIGIPLSFTLETSYCGADQGPYKGFQFGTRELQEIGRNFGESLIDLADALNLQCA